MRKKNDESTFIDLLRSFIFVVISCAILPRNFVWVLEKTVIKTQHNYEKN